MPSITKFTARRFGSRYRWTSSAAISGSSSFSRSVDANASSHAYSSSLRAQSPMFALPPLSPLRAPAIDPSGTVRVGPQSVAGSGAGSSASYVGGPASGDGSMRTVTPSGWVTRCSTRAAST